MFSMHKDENGKYLGLRFLLNSVTYEPMFLHAIGLSTLYCGLSQVAYVLFLVSGGINLQQKSDAWAILGVEHNEAA